MHGILEVMFSDNIGWLWNNSIINSIIKSPQDLIDLIANNQITAAPEIIREIISVTPVGMINIPSYTRWFVRLAGISGASAVALGAYGAHVFYRRDHPEELKQVYETANRYHFLHTLALLGVPMCRHPKVAGSLLAVGTLVFSGTCYYYALTGSRTIRQYTPYGGVMLIAGWMAMVL